MKSGDIIGGKYHLTQPLGAGGMGIVWEAVNERTGRKVALKLILHPTEDLRRRLLREARACGSLAHRNIVEIYDVGETGTGDPFLVMQLLSGETLADLLSRRRRIEPSLAARIGCDVARALAAAHAAKIIHRDLKPANIFLHREADAAEDDFVVKVVDFGVSKNLASSDVPATVSGMIVGSPAYMSPEQIRMTKDIDHRSDIWSLGILLYEMLAGVRPFQGTMEELVRQILEGPIPPVSSRVRQVNPDLDALIAQCLERDRGKRIHSAADLVRRLEALMEANGATRVQIKAALLPPASETSRARIESCPDIPKLTEAKIDAALPATASPAGTELLSPMDPIASPAPAWRLELQEVLAKNRQQSSPALPANMPIALAHGGTVAMSSDAVEQVAANAGDDAKATISTAATVRPALAAGSAAPTPVEEKSRPHGRRSHMWIYVAISAVTAVIVILTGFFGPQMLSPSAGGDGPGLDGQSQAAPAPAPQAEPSQVVVPMPPSSPVAAALSAVPVVSSTPRPKPAATPASPKPGKKLSEPIFIFDQPLNLGNPYDPAKRK